MSDEKPTTAATLHWNDAKSDEEIVRFGPDGVSVNPDIPMDEAARKFLDIVHAMWGAHFTRPAIEAERARLRAKVQAVYDHVGQLGAPGSDPFDFGRITALRQVLDIIDREAPPQ